LLSFTLSIITIHPTFPVHFGIIVVLVDNVLVDNVLVDNVLVDNVLVDTTTTSITTSVVVFIEFS